MEGGWWHCQVWSRAFRFVYILSIDLDNLRFLTSNYTMNNFFFFQAMFCKLHTGSLPRMMGNFSSVMKFDKLRCLEELQVEINTL